MNLNIVPYCTILIIAIRRLDVVASIPTASPKTNRNQVAYYNINNNNFAPVAGGAVQQASSFNVSDSDDEIELDGSNLNNSAPKTRAPVPGRTPVAATPVVRATTPRAQSISLADSDFEGATSMPVPAAASRPRTAQPVSVGPQVASSSRPRMPVSAGATASRSQGISLTESEFEGPTSMPRPSGAPAPRAVPVAAQPVRAAVPVAAQAMPGAVPVAAQPIRPGMPVAAQPARPPTGGPQASRSQGISLADSDFEGPSSMPRPSGAPAPRAAQPVSVGPARPPTGGPQASRSQGISLADSDFEGPSSMPRPGGRPQTVPGRPPPGFPMQPPFGGPAPPTKVMVSGQAPGSSTRSNFEDIPLSEAEDDFGSAGPKRPLAGPPKARASGGFEDIALSDTEGFDPIGPPGPGARMKPSPAGFRPSKPVSSPGSGDFEDVQIEGFSDFDPKGPRKGQPPKTKPMPGSKMDDIVLSEAGEFDDILSETDADGGTKGPRRAPGFGPPPKGPAKPGDAGSLYEVKVQDKAPGAREAPKPPPTKVQSRPGFVESLKLVVDVSKKWSTDELEYRRNDPRRMDVFTAVDPHLIYKVKNFDDTLWQAKNDKYVKMVEIESREDQPPLVTVYLPDEMFPATGEGATGVAVEEEQMSDYSGYSKFAVRHKKMSEALMKSGEGEIKVTEVRPGACDSDTSIIETQRPKKRHRPGLLLHLVMLDIKNKQSSDKITYERQGDFDVFTAVEPYLIDKVQKRNQLIWQSTNMNYASRVIQKKTGNKRNFRIFFPYLTAQCSDSGSDDERIRREVDEHFKQAQLEANHLAKMQAAQAAHMYGPQAPHAHPYQQYYPAPAAPHAPPPQFYRPLSPHYYGPHHPGVVQDPYTNVSRYPEAFPSQPKRRYRPSHHPFHMDSPSDRWSDQRRQHGREPEVYEMKRSSKKVVPESDPLVEIVEMYKVEERELDEESEPETPDFFKHITIDVDYKRTTDRYLYEVNDRDKTEIFTAKDPYLVGIIKKGDRILWRSKDGRYSKRFIMRERFGDLPLLKVFLPRIKPPSSRTTQPRRVDLDINYKFSTNEYDYKTYRDDTPQRVTRDTYLAKGGNKFHVVRRSDHVIWRAGDDSELSDQVVVLKYHDIRTEQVMINMPDGTARRYTKPEKCVNFYRNWAEKGSVPLFSPTTESVALDISNKYDTHYYQYVRSGDVSTFIARYGYVFTAVLDRRYVVWSSSGTEFAVIVEIIGDYDMTIQLCTTNRRFAKAPNEVWYEYTDKLNATPIYVRSSQYLI